MSAPRGRPENARRWAYARAVGVAITVLGCIGGLFTQPLLKVASFVFIGIVGWAAMRWGYRPLFERLIQGRRAAWEASRRAEENSR